MEWLGIVSPVIAAAGAIAAAWFAFRGKRGETAVARSVAEQEAIAARWDDASDLAKYLREQIEAEVERKVAPLRAELQRVKDETHELQDAVRAREMHLWVWDHKGRPGDLPALPPHVLMRLGLAHLAQQRSLHTSKEPHE